MDNQHNERNQMIDMYCKPREEGLSSRKSSVARDLSKMFQAISRIDQNLVDGEILDHLRSIHMEIRDRLEAEGWTITTVNGSLEGTNHWNVYPPGSPTGKKIRKWRAAEFAA